jgi:hypothetical protein
MEMYHHSGTSLYADIRQAWISGCSESETSLSPDLFTVVKEDVGEGSRDRRKRKTVAEKNRGP